MLNIFISLVLSFNLAIAGSRFSDEDKQKFMNDVKQDIASHKMENKGNVDLQIIKPGLYDELDTYYKQEKLTRDEMIKIKQRYEDFSKNSSRMPAIAIEEEFYKFIQSQLNEINRSQVSKIKEGQVCNNWSCDEGLKCAIDPLQEDGKSCRKEGRECREDKDCCSSSCTLDKSTNKRICEDVYRCFKPLALGQACVTNPVCGEGDCLPYNSRTSGIGECEERGYSCKKNSDCCSNSCDRNRCVDSFICKDCVKNGKKPTRGQKCCEGLYLNEKGICIPDVPPFVIPQVNNKSPLLKFLASILIENANALTPEEEQKILRDKIATEIATKVGAKSNSPADIEAALNTYNETPEDIAKIKQLAALDPEYKALYDKAIAAEKAEDAAEAARTINITTDSSEMTNTVLSNKEKYSNFQAESIKEEAVKVKTPEMKFVRKSDFVKCDVRFKDDFANYLKTSNLIDLELALLSFDYMLLGDGVNDYWTKNSDASSSIYGRLKKVAVEHQKIRTDTNKKMADINQKLTCMCLDVIGYSNIKDAAKKSFFEKECPEYKIAISGEVCSTKVACGENEKGTSTCTDGLMPISCKKGDAGCTCTGAAITDVEGETASGVKGKRLLVEWTDNLEMFNASLAVDNTKTYTGISEVSNWATNEAKWNDAENRTYSLFNFNVKKPSATVVAAGGLLGALLAAGVIAVLGGFATTSILTAWAAAGIIATSAVTGGTGLWLIASLKGAWISKRPEIFDKVVRSYTCGKKETCKEYSRELNQPYNDICKVHTSANACVKNFVVYAEGGEYRYLVDPWIPKDIQKSFVIRDLGEGRNYAEKMEDGFQSAKAFMISKNPGATGGGGKSGGKFVSEDYMRTLFVDADVLGKYTPKIGLDDKRFLLDAKIIQEIKNKAKKFAIDEKFFEEGDTENLNNFAEYTYQYHFIWPKTSRQREISYPTIGLTTYLELMSNGVAANMATGATNASKTFGNLNANYLEDYLKTLKLYRDLPINQSDKSKLDSLNAEIAKIQIDLDNQKAFNALTNNTGLDGQLLGVTPGVNSLNAINGGAGTVKLTSGQAGFLNAIGTLRNARKAQLKKLDTYARAIKGGNSDRAGRVAAAAKKFTSNFTKPRSGSSLGKGGGLFGAGGIGGSGSLTGTEGGDLSKSDSASKNNYGADGVNDSGYGSGSGDGSGSGSSGSSGDGKNSDSANSSGAGGSGGVGSDEDSRRLTDAIEARNRASQGKYQSSEEQTIFEKVTNAYIRNYDKVLTKKSEKDVIEQKK
jgi:hypothetical protein